MTKKSKKPKLELATPAKEVKLDLGGGQNPREGFECVDLNAPSPKHRVDLFKFPWPFKDNSVDELHASHFIEHIPCRDVEERDIAESVKYNEVLRAGSGLALSPRKKYLGQDMLFAFFDECYRILKPNGWLTLIWPALQSARAFQDPTHRRFIPMEMVFYLDPAWRKANGLDHYRVKCHFAGDVNFSMQQEESVRAAEVQAIRFRHYWNTVLDYHAKMKKIVTP